MIQNFYAANFYAPNIFVSKSWMISLQTKVVWITLYNVKFTNNNPISENFRLRRDIAIHFIILYFIFIQFQEIYAPNIRFQNFMQEEIYAANIFPKKLWYMNDPKQARKDKKRINSF